MHGYYLVPHGTSTTHRIAYTHGASAFRPPCRRTTSAEPWVMSTWWARPADEAISHAWSYILKRLLLMVPDAVRRAAGHLRRDPVRAGRAGGADWSRRKGRVGGGESRRRRGYRGGRAWTPSGSSRSRSCTASTSRRSSASADAGAYARFDLGTSFYQRKAVWELIVEKLPVSISLGMWTSSSATSSRCRWAWPRRCARARASTSVTTMLDPGRLRDSRFRARRRAAGVFRRRQLQWFPLRGLTSANWDNSAGAARSPTISGTSRCRSRPWWPAASRSSRC